MASDNNLIYKKWGNKGFGCYVISKFETLTKAQGTPRNGAVNGFFKLEKELEHINVTTIEPIEKEFVPCGTNDARVVGIDVIKSLEHFIGICKSFYMKTHRKPITSDAYYEDVNDERILVNFGNLLNHIKSKSTIIYNRIIEDVFSLEDTSDNEKLFANMLKLINDCCINGQSFDTVSMLSNSGTRSDMTTLYSILYQIRYPRKDKEDSPFILYARNNRETIDKVMHEHIDVIQHGSLHGHVKPDGRITYCWSI